MSDGVVAGKIEIPVESDTTGFDKRLRTKLEAITENIVAKIKVEADADTLKETLEAQVKKASKGLAATIDVEISDASAGTLRNRLEAVVKKASAGVAAKVGVHVDTKDADKGLGGLFGRGNRKLRIDAEVNKPGFFASWRAARALVDADTKRKPIELPFSATSFRSAFKPLMLMGITSLVQPLVATIGGAIGGLAAMVGPLAASVKTVAVLPAIIAASASGMGVIKMAASALEGDIKKLPKPLQDVKRFGEEFGKSWAKVRENVAMTLFSKDFTTELRRTASTWVPLLNGHLTATAAVMRDAGINLMSWAQSPLVQGKVSGLLADSRGLLDAGLDSLEGWLTGFLDITTAASPMVKRLSEFVRGTGDWAKAIGDTKEKQDKLSEGFKYAGDKVAQLWRMTKDLGTALMDMFSAGTESGDSLLASLEANVKQFRDWTGSVKGQNAIKKWFKDIEPVARSVGNLIVDVVKSLARLAQDPNTAKMIDTIRTQLLPTLERFLQNMGKTVGREVIDLITNVLEVLTEMSEAGGPIATGLGYINKALGGLGQFFRDHPGIAEKLGAMLGALLAWRALSFLANASGILSLFSGLQGIFKGGSMALGVAGLGIAVAGLTGNLSGLPGPLSGVVTALGTFLALRQMVPGMTVALTNMKTTLSGWSANVSNFGTGIGGAVRGIGTNAGSGLRGAIGGLGTLVSGALGGPIGIGLAAASTAVGWWAQKSADAKQKVAEHKQWVDELRTSLDSVTGALTEATRAKVADKFASDGTAKAAQKYKVDLGALTEAALGNADAQAKVAEQLRANIVETLKSTPTVAGWTNTMQKQGLTMDDYASALLNGGSELESFSAKMNASGDGSAQFAAGLAAMYQAGRDATKGQRDVAAAVSASNSAVKDAAAKQMTFNDLMNVGGRETAALADKLKGLPAGKSITVQAITADGIAKLTAMGLKVNQMPDGSVTIKALTDAGMKKLSDMGYKVERLPDGDVRIAALTENGMKKLSDLGYKVKTMPDGSVTITATAKTTSAERVLNAAARNRSSTVTQYVRTVGGPTGSMRADGGVWTGVKRFADGGIEAAGRSIKAFANGAEKHVAQIAKAGEWRVWAEDETGGEAYIPLSAAKRTKSMEILKDVAQRFGMTMAPHLNGLSKALTPAPRALSLTAGSPMATPQGGMGGSTGMQLTFEPGSVVISNPVPEPVSVSLPAALRRTVAFGLGDGDED